MHALQRQFQGTRPLPASHGHLGSCRIDITPLLAHHVGTHVAQGLVGICLRSLHVAMFLLKVHARHAHQYLAVVAEFLFAVSMVVVIGGQERPL